MAIIGGGLVGCETAYWLAKKGHTVKIIEMRERILMDASYTTLEAQLAKLDMPEIEVFEKTKVVAAKEGNVVCEKDDGEFAVSADSVVLAVGYKPNSSLYDALWPEIKEVYQVGDNRSTGKIFAANHSAYQVAKSI